MGTLYDYMNWRGELSFTEAPFNEVDSLIFSLLSYLDLKGIVPDAHDGATVSLRAAANAFFSKNPDPRKISMGVIVPKNIIKVFRMAKDTRRFRNVGLKAHVNLIDIEKEMQFSATTFLVDDETTLIVYRGTDDTLVGWKEDFNMSFLPVVPAQEEAVKYLTLAAKHSPNKFLRVTGHSKGGNLAVFASVKCAPHIKKRIIKTYNMDGPGFDEDFISGADYADMRDRIHTVVPQSSVVGMLLEHEENYEVVKSDQVGLLQHNGFSWEVMGGSFIHLDSITGESRIIDETLKRWIAEMSPEERKAAIDSIYDSLTNTNAKTLSDLNADKRKLVKAWSAMNNESRTFVKRCIGLIFKNTK